MLSTCVEKTPMNINKTVLIFLLWICVSGISYTNARALTLSVSPPVFQIALQPGETWTTEVTVKNLNDGRLPLAATIVNLEKNIGDVSATGKFTPRFDDDAGVRKNTVAGWIVLPEEQMVLRPQEHRKIPLTLRVPHDAPPGGHYAALLFSPTQIAKDEGAIMYTSAAISSILYLRVAGDVQEKAAIREFSTKKIWYEKFDDVTLTIRFANTGNVHLRPNGGLVIYDLFGRERHRGAIEFGTILAEQSKAIQWGWSTTTPHWFDIGYYTATAEFIFGDTEQYERRSISFFVAPLFNIGVVMIILMGIIVGISKVIHN